MTWHELALDLPPPLRIDCGLLQCCTSQTTRPCCSPASPPSKPCFGMQPHQPQRLLIWLPDPPSSGVGPMNRNMSSTPPVTRQLQRPSRRNLDIGAARGRNMQFGMPASGSMQRTGQHLQGHGDALAAARADACSECARLRRSLVGTTSMALELSSSMPHAEPSAGWRQAYVPGCWSLQLGWFAVRQCTF